MKISSEKRESRQIDSTELKTWYVRTPCCITYLLDNMNDRKIITWVLFLTMSFGSLAFAAPSAPGGYSVGNFGIAAQVTDEDGPTALIKINPPALGEWLQDFARGKLWITEATNPSRKLHLALVSVQRIYPEYQATFDAEGRLQIHVRMFAPLGFDPEIGFMPVIINQVSLTASHSWRGSIGYTLHRALKGFVHDAHLADNVGVAWGGQQLQPKSDSKSTSVIDGQTFIGITNAPVGGVHSFRSRDEVRISADIDVQPGSNEVLTFIAGNYDENGRYATRFTTARVLLDYACREADSFARQLREFEDALPRTGDASLDAYVRWYTSAGILLTKGDRSGDVLTMGYMELNQRDSFWSTGVHLIMWQSLECQMILETIAGQRPDGRIPVTLLPLTDRGDEIDSSEYFILRVARYYSWYRDRELLRKAWPSVQAAIRYLQSRDLQHVGVPMQTSYWADWKDIPQVQGRIYAPYFDLLWVAALHVAIGLAQEMGDHDSTASYQNLERRADEFINRPLDRGGLWAGSHYADRWRDSEPRKYVLLDQVVAAYFGVISRQKLETIYKTLRASETQFGERETYPYAPYGSGFWPPHDGPGNYHNGGVWPYLNFIDAATRYLDRRPADAERIIREVAVHDLETGGDYLPGEFLNAESGENLGFAPQAWDAVLFSAIYFGALGVERVTNDQFRVTVTLPRDRSFKTQLHLPGCSGTLRTQGSGLVWQPERCSPNLHVTVIDARS